MEYQTLKCQNCGSVDLDTSDVNKIKCNYCGTVQTAVPDSVKDINENKINDALTELRARKQKRLKDIEESKELDEKRKELEAKIKTLQDEINRQTKAGDKNILKRFLDKLL